MSGASFRPFLSPRREKGNKRLWNVLFSLCREKSTKRAPPKVKTHGFHLWKPLSFSARATLSRVRAERNAVECGTSRCQVGTSPRTRNGVGATPVAVNPSGCNRTLIAKQLAQLPPSNHNAAHSQALGTITSAHQYRQLPATALLQRRRGYMADCRLNSAFAVPERVSSAQTREGEASAPQGERFPKEETVGFFLWCISFGTFLVA